MPTTDLKAADASSDASLLTAESPVQVADDETLLTAESLIEEVSIDGMCGVY